MSALSPVYAQESLAGVGAATAIGGTLGAAAGTSITGSGATSRVRGNQNELIDEAGEAGGANAAAGGSAEANGGAATSYYTPPMQYRSQSGSEIVQQLRATSTRAVRSSTTTRTTRTSRTRQPARSASAQVRTKQVMSKYKVPPVGWRSKYLAADRYKMGKVWRYVSTEDSSYYYRPEDLARRNFNPNRVIGFSSWQTALAAGYRPDPISKPEPAPQIVSLSNSARGDNFYQFVEFVYAGQVNPAQFDATYSYARQVIAAINQYPRSRGYISPTLDRVFLATITGNPNLIPKTVGGPPPSQTTTVGVGAPNFPNMPSPNAMP